MREGALGGCDVFLFSRPRLLRRRLERAAVGERQAPGQSADPVDRVEVRGRLLVRLAARQECDPGHRRRYARLENTDGLFRHFLDRGALRAFLARYHHVRLEHGAFELDPRVIEFLIDRLEDPLADHVHAPGDGTQHRDPAPPGGGAGLKRQPPRLPGRSLAQRGGGDAVLPRTPSGADPVPTGACGATSPMNGEVFPPAPAAPPPHEWGGLGRGISDSK